MRSGRPSSALRARALGSGGSRARPPAPRRRGILAQAGGRVGGDRQERRRGRADPSQAQPATWSRDRRPSFSRRTLPARLALADGDLALFVAGPDRVSSPALDRVRHEAARRLALVRESAREFLWVLDFPLFERDAVSGQAGCDAPSVHVTAPRRPASISRATRTACGRWRTTSCSTARSWAAGASASTTRRCRSACSACWASMRRRRGSASGSCSRDCDPARRRTAGSRSGSTGS